MTPRLLVLRPLGLGDLLAAVPALRALRQALPRHAMTVAAPAALTPVLQLTGVVDEVVDATDDHRPLGLSRPDVAVDLHGNGVDSLERLRATDPLRIIGFRRRGLDGDRHPAWWRPGPRPDLEHERDRWCRLVRVELGATAPSAALRLDAPAASPRPGCVIVHPGASTGARRWPTERFAQVARWLVDQGHGVVVTGSADEVPLARAVCEQAGLSPRTMAAGRTSTDDLLRLAAGARLVVSGDTGVGHLGAAFDVPSVVLFGPVSPRLWGPPTSPRHAAIWHGDDEVARPGDAHGRTVDPLLLQVSVQEVLVACTRVLETRRVAA